MTPNRDHTTLFLAPLAQSACEAAGGPEPTVDSGVTAMRRLRHPFAIQAAQAATAATEPTHPV